MQILNAFSPSATPFLLEADLQLKGSFLQLDFALTDDQGLFEVPALAVSYTGDQVPRQDGLWMGTCFEAFLQPKGLPHYYEFNFSLAPAWNVYEFDDYRSPQPPKASSDFALQSLRWEPSQKRLVIELENKAPFKKYQMGLTAILQEKSGHKHYCALVHKGEKPDFHLRESFKLFREVTT